MKVQIFDISGSKKSELNTDIFEAPIREDIVQRVAEVEKVDDKQPYAPYLWAGMDISASGNVKHNRHVWKTDRGKGMGRFPKKRLSDKGDRFTWVGAVVPGMRGGRRAHPPKIERRSLKINKKEFDLALKSALAMVSSNELIKKKYASLQNSDIKINLPIVLSLSSDKIKTKKFFEGIEKIIGEELMTVALQDKTMRTGVGKLRGRKYKKNAGLLIVTGNKESIRISGVEICSVKELRVKDLAVNGARLTIFTEQAIKDLEERLNGKKEVENKKEKAGKK